MKKRITALSLVAAVSVGAMGIAAAADEQPIKVLVNGVEVEFADAEPFIEDDRTLVPMRAIFEALGAEVTWDDETKTVVSYDPISEVSITMQIGSNTMFVDETPVELDVPAKIVNDRTVVPVRAIAEGMNSLVDWNAEERLVIVTKDMEAQIANPWLAFETIDELNEAIGKSGAEYTYSVRDLNSELILVKLDGYRYLPDDNLAEIQAVYTVGSSADITVRTQPGDADISGIYGGEKIEEYILDNSLVEVYKLENTIYAVWSCEDAGTVFSHSVAVTALDFDATEILKGLVYDTEMFHPRG